MCSPGVIAYILLRGHPYFIRQNQRELFRNIFKGHYEFHKEYLGPVSAEAKALIWCLLTIQLDKRPIAKEVLNHKFLRLDFAMLKAYVNTALTCAWICCWNCS